MLRFGAALASIVENLKRRFAPVSRGKKLLILLWVSCKQNEPPNQPRRTSTYSLKSNICCLLVRSRHPGMGAYSLSKSEEEVRKGEHACSEERKQGRSPLTNSRELVSVNERCVSGKTGELFRRLT